MVYTVRSKIKKIETAMITRLQLAARKNLIQMSSDVINYNYNSNCHSGVSRHLSTTCLEYFLFVELMQVIIDNCNLIHVPGLDCAKVI
jgi:hypothetical protein